MLRIVADTNVIVSALATRRVSPPRAIYQAISVVVEGHDIGPGLI